MKDIIMLVIGLLLSVFGVLNISGNVSTIHLYNRRNVKEEDIPKYGRAVGIGTLIIGLSLIIGFILMLLKANVYIKYIEIPSIVIGLGFILYGQIKYNKGLF